MGVTTSPVHKLIVRLASIELQELTHRERNDAIGATEMQSGGCEMKGKCHHPLRKMCFHFLGELR